MLESLVSGQLIETLVQQSIERLDETIKDEADAIHNALSVVENVCMSFFSMDVFCISVFQRSLHPASVTADSVML